MLCSFCISSTLNKYQTSICNLLQPDCNELPINLIAKTLHLFDCPHIASFLNHICYIALVLIEYPISQSEKHRTVIAQRRLLFPSPHNNSVFF